MLRPIIALLLLSNMPDPCSKEAGLLDASPPHLFYVF